MGPGNEQPYGGRSAAISLRKLVDALELLPLPSLVLVGDGSALAVNKEWTLLSGLLAEDSWGEGWLGALEPLDRGPLRRRLEGAAAVGEPGSGDFRLTGPDGGQWCRWWWRPGAASQLVVCVTDLEQSVPVPVLADTGPWPRAAAGRSACSLVRRGEFVAKVARALRHSRRTGAMVAVVAADLKPLRAAAGSDDGVALMAARQVVRRHYDARPARLRARG
jgi:hypothetical protein